MYYLNCNERKHQSDKIIEDNWNTNLLRLPGYWPQITKKPFKNFSHSLKVSKKGFSVIWGQSLQYLHFDVSIVEQSFIFDHPSCQIGVFPPAFLSLKLFFLLNTCNTVTQSSRKLDKNLSRQIIWMSLHVNMLFIKGNSQIDSGISVSISGGSWF